MSAKINNWAEQILNLNFASSIWNYKSFRTKFLLKIIITRTNTAFQNVYDCIYFPLVTINYSSEKSIKGTANFVSEKMHKHLEHEQK